MSRQGKKETEKERGYYSLVSKQGGRAHRTHASTTDKRVASCCTKLYPLPTHLRVLTVFEILS